MLPMTETTSFARWLERELAARRINRSQLATPMGRLMLKLMASFAEFYSDNLASSACPSRRSSPRLNQAETEAGAPI